MNMDQDVYQGEFLCPRCQAGRGSLCSECAKSQTYDQPALDLSPETLTEITAELQF